MINFPQVTQLSDAKLKNHHEFSRGCTIQKLLDTKKDITNFLRKHLLDIALMDQNIRRVQKSLL